MVFHKQVGVLWKDGGFLADGRLLLGIPFSCLPLGCGFLGRRLPAGVLSLFAGVNLGSNL